jgi:hypothetical protein
MTAATSWTEVAYVTITAQSGTDVDFCSISESINIDEGERPVETNYTLCGGKIIRTMVQGDTTVTLKAYPTQAGTPGTATVGKGFHDMFYDSAVTDSVTTGQIEVNNTRGTRKKFRLSVLWTNDSSSNSALRQVVSPTYAALRWTGRNGYITKIAPSFEANGQLAFDVTFLFPSNQADGTCNIQVESISGEDATATMTTLSSYTSDTSGF